jgi:CelD/BcsL family acetyltransferase involved in cellulose biosynthesis
VISVEALDGIAAVTAEWDALADRVGAAPFLRPGWIDAWWSAFGRGSLELLAARVDGRLAGFLPLRRHRGRLNGTANWHTPLFGPVAETAAVEAALLRYACEAAPGRVSLRFVVLGDAQLARWAKAARAAGRKPRTRVLVSSPRVEIEGDWGSYEERLGRNLRANIRRAGRRLAAAGELSLEVADGREDLDALLAEGLRIEPSGWKTRTAIQARPQTARFYGDVARWAADRGYLRLAFLRLDGRAIAFQLALEADGVYYALKGGYDPAFRRSSPGVLLIHKTLARAFATGLTRYELLGSAEPYKLAFATSSSRLLAFDAFAATPAGAVDRIALVYGFPILRRGAVGRVLRNARRSFSS